MTVDEQVAEFHKVMGIPDRATPGIPDEATLRLRLRLVLEEAFELAEATAGRGGKQDLAGYKERVLALVSRMALEPNLPEIADALADIDYDHFDGDPRWHLVAVAYNAMMAFAFHTRWGAEANPFAFKTKR